MSNALELFESIMASSELRAARKELAEERTRVADLVTRLRPLIALYARPDYYAFLLDEVARDCDPTAKAAEALRILDAATGAPDTSRSVGRSRLNMAAGGWVMTETLRQRFWRAICLFAYRRWNNPITVQPVGLPGHRDPESPCDYYTPRPRHPLDWSERCEGDGHYLCKRCAHLQREALTDAPPR